MFEKCLRLRPIEQSALCRSQQEFSNEYLVAKIGFDKAENEPCKICPLFRVHIIPDPPGSARTWDAGRGTPRQRRRGHQGTRSPRRPKGWQRRPRRSQETPATCLQSAAEVTAALISHSTPRQPRSQHPRQMQPLGPNSAAPRLNFDRGLRPQQSSSKQNRGRTRTASRSRSRLTSDGYCVIQLSFSFLDGTIWKSSNQSRQDTRFEQINPGGTFVFRVPQDA